MPSTVLAMSILIILAVSVQAQPADSLTTDLADSLGTGQSDSLGIGLADSLSEEEVEDLEGWEGQEEGQGRAGGKKLGRRRQGRAQVADTLREQALSSWFWNTHPDLSIKINKKKDVTNWDTNMALRKKINSKIKLNLSATLHTRENTTLNRSDSNDGTTAGLTYALSPDVNFGLRYNSTVSANRFDLRQKEPDERRRKQDVSVSADFSRALSDVVDIHLSTTAGSTQNAFTSVSNEGSRQDLSASISYKPTAALQTTVSYSAKRLLLDSQVDSSGASVFSSKDRTFSQDISLSAKYDVAKGIKVNIDASRSNQEQQNPDPERKEQETHLQTSRRASAKVAFDIWQQFSWDVSVNFSDNDNQFGLRSDKNNATAASALKASAKVMPWAGAVINMGGSRETTRSRYLTPDTGRDLHKSLSLKLTQDLGPKVDLNLTALSDMVSVFYDDKKANENDRDRLSNRISSDLTYKPFENLDTRLAGEYSEETSVYIAASKSSGNRTTRKYRLSGSYDLKTFYRVTLNQDYDISAIYTFYQYGENRNTLVRNSNVSTSFKIPVVPRLNLNVGHDYKFQDQGSYRETRGQRLYARSTERETHVMSIACRYNPCDLIKISVRQSYQIQRNWNYERGQKKLQYQSPQTDISGRVVFNYKFGERTKFSLTFEQNRREGPQVSKAFRSFRNIELEASHVF